MDGAKPPATVLAIAGMTCAGCANAVKRVLSAVPGVGAVAVDLAAGRAEIAGSAAEIDLIAAVKAAGYGAAPWRGGEAHDRGRDG